MCSILFREEGKVGPGWGQEKPSEHSGSLGPGERQSEHQSETELAWKQPTTSCTLLKESSRPGWPPEGPCPHHQELLAGSSRLETETWAPTLSSSALGCGGKSGEGRHMAITMKS